MGFLAWRTGEAGGSLGLPSQTPPNLLYLLPYLLKTILLILLILSKTFLSRAVEEVRRRASDDRRE